MPSVAIIGTRGYPSYYGGFETAVRKLAPYLADQGWDVTVFSRPGATAIDDPNRDPRISVVETRGLERKSLSTLSFGFSATRHTLKLKPDAVLVMNVANGYWLPALKRAGIPTLVNVDGIEWDRAKWGAIAKWVFRTGAKLTAKYGDLLVYDSREIARRWLENFHVEGIFIPYGGDSVNESLPLEPGLRHRDYVLVVARFVPENTIPEFFKAAAAIARQTDVVIVGSSGYGGPLDDEAKRLSQENDRVHWLGHVSDDARLYALWQHAGVYFHGHSVGGTNPTLVQAMALGAPIVARDTAYNREVLGDKGTFVDPNPDAIERGVIERIESARTRADASPEPIPSSYTWPSVNAAYAEALNRLRSGGQ